jgi:hypothetical protein
MNEEYLDEIQPGNPQQQQCHSLQCNPSIILLVTCHLFTENLQSLSIIYQQMLIKRHELQKVHELNPNHLKIHLQHVIYN